MAAAKRGLGRGLDALLDPHIMDESADRQNQGITEVDILSIDTNRQQPRKTFSEESLNELAASIREHGIVQPLIVRKKGERYLIVAGERRFRAARIAKLKKVPVIIVDYDEKKMREISLIENIQRENLNPIEEAQAIRFLMQEYHLTQEELSDRLGKSRPVIANSLRLLFLPDSITQMIREGKISAGHGRAIAGINDEPLQMKLAEETVNLGYSVRALENRIQNIHQKKKKKEKEQQSSDMKHLERIFREKTGTKVHISGSEEKGKIIFEYASKDQLQQVYECLMGE